MEEGGAAAQPLGPQPDPELQQLEALADELQGTAAEAEQTAGGDGAAAAAAAGAAAEQQPAAGPYAAGPAYDNGQLVHQCWEEAVDMNSGHRYWFNRAMVRPLQDAAGCGSQVACCHVACAPCVFIHRSPTSLSFSCAAACRE